MTPTESVPVENALSSDKGAERIRTAESDRSAETRGTTPRWWRRWRDALRESQRGQVADARRRGYCCCPAGELGAVAGEPHAEWCGVAA